MAEKPPAITAFVNPIIDNLFGLIQNIGLVALVRVVMVHLNSNYTVPVVPLLTAIATLKFIAPLIDVLADPLVERVRSVPLLILCTILGAVAFGILAWIIGIEVINPMAKMIGKTITVVQSSS